MRTDAAAPSGWLMSLIECTVTRSRKSADHPDWINPKIAVGCTGVSMLRVKRSPATGVKVTAVDVAPFREAVKPVWEKMKLTQLVGTVRETLKK